MRLDQTKANQILRQKARAEVDEWFAEQLRAGYTVPDLGFRLGLAQEDVTLLTGAFVLAKEAAAMGLEIPPLIDADGVPHSLDLPSLTSVMLGYGRRRAEISSEYAVRVSAIGE
jgi:hypothetical protein